MGTLYAAFQHAFRQQDKEWRLVKYAISDPLLGETDARVDVNYHDATRHKLMDTTRVTPDAFSFLENTTPDSSLGQLTFSVTADYETPLPASASQPSMYPPTVRVVCNSTVRTAASTGTDIRANILVTEPDV